MIGILSKIFIFTLFWSQTQQFILTSCNPKIFDKSWKSQEIKALRSPYQDAEQLKQSIILLSNGLATISATSLFPSIFNTTNTFVSIPLVMFDSVYCISYAINGNIYGGIVDTGSPFLLVPSVCSKLWGCHKNAKYRKTDLPSTTEIYGGQDYDVVWKKGYLTFPKSKNSNKFPVNRGKEDRKEVIFAEVGYDVFRPPGGVFIGLIKEKNDNIKPTLLGQLNYKSIMFDTKNMCLTLSHNSIIPRNQNLNVVNLIDLRPFGVPVSHYAAKIKKLEINGKEVANDRPIYAIFDTGCTGCTLSDDLANDENTPNPPRQVKLILDTESGGETVFEAKASNKDIFVVTSTKIEWFKKNNSWVKTSSKRPEVVVVGLAFLRNKILTIDVDDSRLLLSDEPMII